MIIIILLFAGIILIAGALLSFNARRIQGLPPTGTGSKAHSVPAIGRADGHGDN